MWIDLAYWCGGFLCTIILIGLGKRALDFGTFLQMELKKSDAFLCRRSLHQPLITVIIPAKNEERFIELSARSILNCHYSASELILVDDRSQDRTLQIMEHLAEEDPRIKVISLGELPPGWTGKTHALFRGGQMASGDILVFTDADTVFSQCTLPLTLDYLLENDLAMLSLAPGYSTRGFIEDVIHPYLAMGLLFFYPLKDVNDDAKPDALASGCYIMITKKAYEKIGTWAAFKDEITEDVAMSKTVKAVGLKLATLRGDDLIRTKPFESFSELSAFWKRSYYGGLSRNPLKTTILMFIFLLLLAPLVFCVLSAILIVVGLSSPAVSFLFVSSCLVAAAMVLPHSIFLARSNGKWYYSLAAPVAVVFGAGISASTLACLICKRGIRWHGTLYK